jgi:hypothetical protein
MKNKSLSVKIDIHLSFEFNPKIGHAKIRRNIVYFSTSRNIFFDVLDNFCDVVNNCINNEYPNVDFAVNYNITTTH